MLTPHFSGDGISGWIHRCCSSCYWWTLYLSLDELINTTLAAAGTSSCWLRSNQAVFAKELVQIWVDDAISVLKRSATRMFQERFQPAMQLIMWVSPMLEISCQAKIATVELNPNYYQNITHGNKGVCLSLITVTRFSKLKAGTHFLIIHLFIFGKFSANIRLFILLNWDDTTSKHLLALFLLKIVNNCSAQTK